MGRPCHYGGTVGQIGRQTALQRRPNAAQSRFAKLEHTQLEDRASPSQGSAGIQPVDGSHSSLASGNLASLAGMRPVAVVTRQGMFILGDGRGREYNREPSYGR
jgi:hypothetical protein